MIKVYIWHPFDVSIWLVGMESSSDWLEWCIHLIGWNGVSIWLVGMESSSDWLEWCIHLIGWNGVFI